MAKSFPVRIDSISVSEVTIKGDLPYISENFNKGKSISPFKNSGVMIDRKVYTAQTVPQYDGPYVSLGDILVEETDVPEAFYIDSSDVAKWEYAKGGK